MSMPPPPPPFGSDQPQPGYGQPAYGQPPAYGTPPSYPGGGYGGYGYQAAPAYASFGARLGALLIDSLIGALFAIPAIIALNAVPTTIEECTIDGDPRLCEVPTGAGWAIIIGLGVLFGLAYLIWFAKMVGKGQSIGMKATNIRVADAQSGEAIGTGRAVGWYFAHIISGMICYLGYLWMLWDSKKQTWHDKIVGTVVVKS